jgi:ubiquinone/menaquinone biosynthesis C-methylase UbiE
VYELGAKLVMMGDNDDYKFHRLFVSTALPARPYRRIVDLGCGFGKSTWPLKRSFPDAEVIGVDLAAPCLRLAARRADAQRLQIRFRQADAIATGLEDHSADLVTSTMLVHEVPVQVLPQVFTEAARLLAPGGVLRFLDFQPTGDAFRDLAMIEHGARNNEPFMPPMMAADLPAMARAAGLTRARWIAFDERARGRLASLDWPPRSEWHFPWAVLEAEKPA